MISDALLLNSMGTMPFERHYINSLDLRTRKSPAALREERLAMELYQNNSIALLKRGIPATEVHDLTEQYRVRNKELFGMGANIDRAIELMYRHRDSAILLLEGGSDIHPSLYGQANRSSYCNEARDDWEISLIKSAEKLDIPIFGICRGHQLLAAYYGGTLWQDIQEDLKIQHVAGELKLSGIFSEWFPKGYHVNSYHHQAVNVVPENGEVVGVDANDGIIESIRYPRAFTVQFHPEGMGDLGAALLQKIVTYLRNN